MAAAAAEAAPSVEGLGSQPSEGSLDFEDGGEDRIPSVYDNSTNQKERAEKEEEEEELSNDGSKDKEDGVSMPFIEKPSTTEESATGNARGSSEAPTFGDSTKDSTIALLVDMGYGTSHSIAAVEACGGDLGAALDFIMNQLAVPSETSAPSSFVNDDEEWSTTKKKLGKSKDETRKGAQQQPKATSAPTLDLIIEKTSSGYHCNLCDVDFRDVELHAVRSSHRQNIAKRKTASAGIAPKSQSRPPRSVMQLPHSASSLASDEELPCRIVQHPGGGKGGFYFFCEVCKTNLKGTFDVNAHERKQS